MTRNRPCLTEQETIIRWDNEGKEASVYTYDRKLIRRLGTLAEKYPDEFIFLEEDPYGAVTYQIPKKYVTVRPPYNEEKRQKQIINAKDNKDLFRKKSNSREQGHQGGGNEWTKL